MRAIGLVLAAVAFSLTFTTAEAARRSDQPTASRSSASSSRAPAATVRPATATSSTRATARPAMATSSRGTLVRTAYASPSSGHRSAASQRGGRYAAAAAPVCSRSVVRGRTVSRCTAGASAGQTRLAWQAGLAPAAHVQTSDCPEGTMATLATGHTNVVRCMPI